MTPKIGFAAQETLDGEIIVDGFAGGGGASTGIETALGRIVNAAINHDPAAILMHRTNHPYTEHYQESIWMVDPKSVCRGRPVALLWVSPDCKHFSKAKGAALVDRHIRGLAWVTLRWAGTVRPRVIILENVEEFQTWGPVRRGKPVKSKSGQTFQKFLSQLRSLGYEIDYRELVAADYGAPTTRKRFVMIARCDGKPIVWPKPTHAPRDSEAVKSGKLLPWRSAAEIIDWNLPCPSIFDTKKEIKDKYGLSAVRPLADNTLRRVIRGVDKFTIKSAEPFIVQCNHAGGDRTQSAKEPLPTVSSHHGFGVTKPVMVPFTATNTSNSVGASAGNPMNTVRTGGGGGQMLITPYIVPTGYGEAPGQLPRVQDVNDPLNTVVGSGKHMVAAPSLIQYHTEQSENVRAAGLDKPINTVDASNRYGLTCANLVEYYGNGHPLDAREPMHTATSHDREALTTAHIAKFYGGVVGEGAKEPLPTVTSVDHNALTTAHVVKFKGDNLGQPAAEPMQTETAGGGQFAVCKVHLCKIRPEDSFGHWPEIRALLNRYCGYQIRDDEILLLEIGMSLYYIADIGLRMLSPRELYNAMGFPPDYIIDRDYTGKPYPKSQQVARCGNAVCPQMAAAVVAAQLPEYAANPRITTMAELMREVAV